MSPLDEEEYITVVEVKRYAYCPKIIFITHVLHLEEAQSEAMEMGLTCHDERMITPLLALLKASKVLRDVELSSGRLGLVGKLDYLIVSRFGEYVPVEVKYAESDRGAAKWDHRLQLAAYALLVEERFAASVKRGYVYYLRDGKLVGVLLDEGLKRLAEKTVREIYEIITSGREPEVRMYFKKCINCGYRNYCRPGLAGGGGRPQEEYIKRRPPGRVLKKYLRRFGEMLR